MGVVTATLNNQATTTKPTTSVASPAPAPVTTSSNNPITNPTNTSTTTSIITSSSPKIEINRNNVNTPATDVQNNNILSSPKQKKVTQNKSKASKSELLGAKVLKKFEGYGEYEGTVINVPSKSYEYYRIRYVDGDEEDMSDNEVRTCVYQLDK